MNNHKHTRDKWGKRNSQQRTRGYKEPHQNFGTEIHDHDDGRIGGGLDIRMERTEKEPVNWRWDNRCYPVWAAERKQTGKKSQTRTSGTWDQSKNTTVTRVPEGEGKGGWKNIQRNTDENFPNLAKDINLQTQETEWSPNSRPEDHKPRCIIINPPTPQGSSYC